MQINKTLFPNPKLDIPEDFKNKHELSKTSFGYIDTYLDRVALYIFTEINLNLEVNSSEHINAWILRAVSQSVLRSLYIRNSFFDSFNKRNLAGAYLDLKAWVEIVGFLAAILEILEKGLSTDDFYEKFAPFVLGNKGKGDFRIGEIEAKSVAYFIECGNRYISKLEKNTTDLNQNELLKTFFTDYYDVASNPTHPSFDAHDIFGKLNGKGVWNAFTPDQYTQEFFYQQPAYGGLLMSPIFIQNICDSIFELRGNEFRKLGVPYFVS